MDPTRLPLRDVHLPPAPAWWPPAPGWWWLGAGVLLLAATATAAWCWRRRRRKRWLRSFDIDTGTGSAPERLAAMSALLRRAARRARPGSEQLQDEAWLRFLDGRASTRFSEGQGRLLLDGGFRPEIADEPFDAARLLARARFLELMERRR